MTDVAQGGSADKGRRPSGRGGAWKRARAQGVKDKFPAFGSGPAADGDDNSGDTGAVETNQEGTPTQTFSASLKQVGTDPELQAPEHSC